MLFIASTKHLCLRQESGKGGSNRAQSELGQRRIIQEGSTFGESAFFTELPQLEVRHGGLHNKSLLV